MPGIFPFFSTESRESLSSSWASPWLAGWPVSAYYRQTSQGHMIDKSAEESVQESEAASRTDSAVGHLSLLRNHLG